MASQTFQDYEDLLNKSYKDTVINLLAKYGPAADNYFKEKSYQRFMNDKIKSPAKG
ncbi:MAG: hypothetical protein ABF755_03055 [Oenococcus oeni]